MTHVAGIVVGLQEFTHDLFVMPLGDRHDFPFRALARTGVAGPHDFDVDRVAVQSAHGVVRRDVSVGFDLIGVVLDKAKALVVAVERPGQDLLTRVQLEVAPVGDLDQAIAL